MDTISFKSLMCESRVDQAWDESLEVDGGLLTGQKGDQCCD